MSSNNFIFKIVWKHLSAMKRDVVAYKRTKTSEMVVNMGKLS